MNRWLGVFLAVVACVLWVVSWLASASADGLTMTGFWYGFVTVAGLFGATGCTIGSLVIIGSWLFEE